jgi:hypothetical protein
MEVGLAWLDQAHLLLSARITLGRRASAPLGRDADQRVASDRPRYLLTRSSAVRSKHESVVPMR